MTSASEQLNSVWQAALQAGVANRFSIDPRIPESEESYGLGLGIVLLPDVPTVSDIATVIQKIKNFDSSQYLYENESLHITLHSIVLSKKQFLPDETSLMRIKNTIRPAFSGAGFPLLELRGLNIFPGSDAQVGSIVMHGFPNADLLLLRDRIRQSIMDAGFPDRRNYAFGRGDYLTCAIGRLRKQPSIKLMGRIAELREEIFTRFYVSEALFVTNSYFFNPKLTAVHERFKIL